jgi:hypothetical protein
MMRARSGSGRGESCGGGGRLTSLTLRGKESGSVGLEVGCYRARDIPLLHDKGREDASERGPENDSSVHFSLASSAKG